MKKWLIRCLTVLAMVCLIPGIALNAKAESLYCRYCNKFTDCEILGYEKYDSISHTLHIKCKSCKGENVVIDAKYSKHTDDGKNPHLYHRQNLCLMRRGIRRSRSRLGRVDA